MCLYYRLQYLFFLFLDFSGKTFASLSPADSSALGQGPRNALIRDLVASSKSSFFGSLPSSAYFCRKSSSAQDFFSSTVTAFPPLHNKKYSFNLSGQKSTTDLKRCIVKQNFGHPKPQIDNKSAALFSPKLCLT